MIELIEHYLRTRLFQREQWGCNLECLDEEFIVHSGIWDNFGIRASPVSLPSFFSIGVYLVEYI